MTRFSIGLAVVALSAVGCGGETGAIQDQGNRSQESASNTGAMQQTESEAPQPTTELQVDSTKVSFYVDEEGGSVITTTPAGAEPLKLSHEQLTMNMADLYEQLSGQAAPVALVDALARLDEATLNAPAPVLDDEADTFSSDIPDSETLAPADEGVNAYSASRFDEKYCENAEYLRCTTNFVCPDSSCEMGNARTRWMNTWVNALEGDVRFTIQRKNTWGNYKTRVDKQVRKGETLQGYDWTATYKHRRRMQLFDARGEKTHVYVGADDY